MTGPGEPARIYAIAEIGINHCGDMRIARDLVDMAKEAGADAVKFQTFRTELLVAREADRMPYQGADRCGNITQFEMLKQVELSEAQHIELMDHCARVGIDFLSTPYDTESFDMLKRLGAGTVKIASTDTTNLPFLRHIAASGLSVICSTGVCDLWEVARAVDAFGDAGALDRLTLLHCLSYYPAPPEEVNLRAIARMAAAFGVPVGYSDHTLSEEMGAWAVIAGAKVIEKHVTFDRSAPGPDHAASLTPDQFARYVANIRIAEASLGDGYKRVQPSERPVKQHMQKSLVAARDMMPGHVMAADDLTTMRPASGISPLFIDDIVGMRLAVEKAAGTIINWCDLQRD